MCGGIAFKLNKVSKKELTEFYGENKAKKLLENKNSFAYSFFGDDNPCLLVGKNNSHLIRWGNKDDKLLPRTGWAKIESIKENKWEKYNPKTVYINAEKGYEKGVWFDTKGFMGLLVNMGKKEVAYIITKKSGEDYYRMTKHHRQPVESQN